MKILITASSTVGKSTVIAELQRRNFTAIDGDDEPGLVRLELQSTGEPVDWPKGFVDWNIYSWNLQKTKLTEVLNRNQTVFLGGIFGNQQEFYELFDVVVVLTINPEEYKNRLDNRPRRSAGDSEENMLRHFTNYPIHLQRFLDAGAIPVDASGTVKKTVDNILKVIA